MKRFVVLALAGLLLFLVFVLYQLPARYVTTRLPAEVQLFGVQGSVWQGRAEQLVVRGQSLGELEWRWRPAALLTLQWGYRLLLEGEGIDADLEVAVGLDRQVWLADVDALLAAQRINAFLPRQGIDLAGEFQLTAPSLVLQGGWPVAGEAWLVWREAALVGDLPMVLGELTADVIAADDELVAELSDAGGPLELAGSARVSRARSYQADLRLRARAGADNNLRTSLSLIAAPDLTGRYHFSQQGRW